MEEGESRSWAGLAGKRGAGKSVAKKEQGARSEERTKRGKGRWRLRFEKGVPPKVMKISSTKL
jgi:hypothetical protein